MAFAAPGQPHLGQPPCPMPVPSPEDCQEPQLITIALPTNPRPGLCLTMPLLTGPGPGTPPQEADSPVWPRPVPVLVEVPGAQGWDFLWEPWPLHCPDTVVLAPYHVLQVAATSLYTNRRST